MKSLAEKALLAIARNPQDQPQYADPAPPKARHAADIEADWASARLFAKTDSAVRGVSCEYCQDRRYIMVYKSWAIGDGVNSYIPHPCQCPAEWGSCECGGVTQAEVERIVLMNPLRGCGTAMTPDFFFVPCDCHKGFRETPPSKGADSEPKRVRKFDQIFGCFLCMHWLGEALLESRRRKLEKQVIENLPLEPRHPEPDDPPEHELDIIDYAPGWNDPEHVKRRLEQQEEVRKRAEAEGIELETLLTEVEG